LGPPFKVVKKTSKDYPKMLSEIADLPKVLYCRGNISLFNEKYSVSIVGSRKASGYGLENAKKTAFGLAEKGVCIVSGLAMGIDSAAHRGALEAKGKTIAVLGSAINNIYPGCNLSLANLIIEKDGLIISEYPPDTDTHPSNFPERNRIIAGLSQVTTIIEAAKRSGALITAFLAVDYNREVFALPGNVDRTNSAGTNYLIKKGANCLTKPKDILDSLGIEEDKPAQTINLSKAESKVLDFIKNGQNFDEITERIGLSASELNSIIVKLEIKNLLT